MDIIDNYEPLYVSQSYEEAKHFMYDLIHEDMADEEEYDDSMFDSRFTNAPFNDVWEFTYNDGRRDLYYITAVE